MKAFLKPLQRNLPLSANIINDSAELLTCNKLINQYHLDLLSNMDKDMLVSDLEQLSHVFEQLVLAYAEKQCKLEVIDGELKSNYEYSLISFMADQNEKQVLNNNAKYVDVDAFLNDYLKTGNVRIMILSQDNENYIVYFVKTYDVLNDADIKYINKLFNDIKTANNEDQSLVDSLLKKQQECSKKYSNKFKVLKKNQYEINKLAIFNKHFEQLALSTYQLELIFN